SKRDWSSDVCSSDLNMKPHCSVCHGLLPQIKQLMGDFPEIQLGHVDASEVEKVAGRFHIFTVPVLLLFVEGKESIREARIVHMRSEERRVGKECNDE